MLVLQTQEHSGAEHEPCNKGERLLHPPTIGNPPDSKGKAGAKGGRYCQKFVTHLITPKEKPHEAALDRE
jgi:hypothetical protein